MYQDLYGHKTGFMPEKRDLYANLLHSENNRVGRQEFFEPLETLVDKMTVPTEEALDKVDLNEMFVKIELRAVFKIRMMFIKWAQSLVHSSLVQFEDGFQKLNDAETTESVKRTEDGQK